MSGSTTVLDNTNGGTAALSSTSTGLFSTVNNYRAYTFTTAASSTWELTDLRLGLRAMTTAGSYTLVVRLHALSGATPTSTVLASVSLTVAVTTTPGYATFDKTALSTLGSYTLSAGTGYALSVSATSSGIGMPALASPAAPTASGGFTYGGSYFSNSAGSSWSSVTFYPPMQFQVQATCFLRGTLILTSRGEVKVEALRAGDLVATRFGGLRPIRWIGTQRFEGRLAGKAHQPVRLQAGSLGGGVPSCDLHVSPGHAVLVGEVLAHAGALVNGTTIVQERVRGVIEYFHLDLGPHDCVLANGAWAESYFEDRNRDSFHNAAEFHALNPGHVAERQATCLPIVTAGHPGIGALRARLATLEARAAA